MLARRAPLAQLELGEAKRQGDPAGSHHCGGLEQRNSQVSRILSPQHKEPTANLRVSASAVTWRPSPMVALQAEPLPSPVA